MSDFSGDDRRFMPRALELAEARAVFDAAQPGRRLRARALGPGRRRGFSRACGRRARRSRRARKCGSRGRRRDGLRHAGALLAPRPDAALRGRADRRRRVAGRRRDAGSEPAPWTAAASRASRPPGSRPTCGLMAEEAAELNRGFVSRMSRGRPWVTLKLGASLDGRTALANGASKWITGETRARRRAATALACIRGHHRQRHGRGGRPAAHRCATSASTCVGAGRCGSCSTARCARRRSRTCFRSRGQR